MTAQTENEVRTIVYDESGFPIGEVVTKVDKERFSECLEPLFGYPEESE